MTSYPRDLTGYGETPPDPQWPGGAKIAVQFVLNYEEGGENNVLHGDASAETFLSEIANAEAIEGARHMSMESTYEYGSRAGVWRLLRLFEEAKIPLTIFAVATALERYPDMVPAFLNRYHEICCHGYKWINYQHIDQRTEKKHIAQAVDILTNLIGTRPSGWYTGRTSPNTKRLIAEYGGFKYCADDYSDDLPFWENHNGNPLLIVPYTLDANDMRFASPHGFATGEDFYTYLKDTFATLYREGDTHPKMMSIGLHCRLAGRPGRIAGLKRFIDHVKTFDHVWLCRRIDIAEHWHKTYPYQE